MSENVTLRRGMYFCLAIAVIATFSAVSATAVQSVTNGHGLTGNHSLNVPGQVLYDNGATTGQLNAFFIDGPNTGTFEQTISDGFVASGTGTASTLDFVEWVPSGTTPTSISWWLGTSHFGSEISSGSMAQVGFTFFGTTAFGYDTYTSHVTGLSGSLTAGNTYYLTLGGANDNFGTQFDGWDVNEGPAQCYFAVGGVEEGGCPTTESETFVISASGTSVPEPGSFMLLGSGIVGLAGMLRRKIGR